MGGRDSSGGFGPWDMGRVLYKREETEEEHGYVWIVSISVL